MLLIKRKFLRGFTILELLVVIAIIGILATLVLATLSNARNKAKIANVASDLKEINKALDLYVADHDGYYPCFDSNWSDAKEKIWSAPYIDWPKTPWGNNYHWEYKYPPACSDYSCTYSVAIQGFYPNTNPLAQDLDEYLDDGNVDTGIIRRTTYYFTADRINYYGVDQTALTPSPLNCP